MIDPTRLHAHGLSPGATDLAVVLADLRWSAPASWYRVAVGGQWPTDHRKRSNDQN